MRPSPEVVARRFGDQLVLVHLRTDRVYEMNGTAARVWELLGAGCGPEQIQTRLSDEFDVPAAALRREIEESVASMRREELVIGDREDRN